MIKLMKLEIIQMNIRRYVKIAFFLGVFLMFFMYFVAILAQVTQEKDFMLYANVFRFICAISILLFSVYATVMYNECIIKVYSGKRLGLLYTYPISHRKMLMTKVVLVAMMTSVCMLLCTIIPIIIFTIMETIIPLVPDTMTTTILASTFKMIITSILSVNTIAIFAMAIGFIKKSITITILSGLVLGGLYGNLVISTNQNMNIAFIISGFSIIMIIIVLMMLLNKVKHMEVA